MSLHDEVYKEAFDALNKIQQILSKEFKVDKTKNNRQINTDLLEKLRVLEVDLLRYKEQLVRFCKLENDDF